MRDNKNIKWVNDTIYLFFFIHLKTGLKKQFNEFYGFNHIS